jgi:hypothetical protein
MTTMLTLPEAPVSLVSADRRIAVGHPRFRTSPEDLKKVEEEQKDIADFKIEVMFDSRRSARLHKLVPFFVTIWESGKRLHGGGDDKMYWCGYEDCGKPIYSSDFGYMHTVCRHCNRELFLDEQSKAGHIKSLRRENRRSEGIERIPTVVGERFCHLPPGKIAELLAKLWYQLDGKADVYFKYSPAKIRYDKLHETTKSIDNLESARLQREPGIYTLKSIRKDMAGGSDVQKLFLGWVLA